MLISKYLTFNFNLIKKNFNFIFPIKKAINNKSIIKIKNKSNEVNVVNQSNKTDDLMMRASMIL